jgi:hypothetical protein
VTFLVNDILKHQAILLGNAEEQKKKKVMLRSFVIYSKKCLTICKNYFDDRLEIMYIILLISKYYSTAVTLSIYLV